MFYYFFFYGRHLVQKEFLEDHQWNVFVIKVLLLFETAFITIIINNCDSFFSFFHYLVMRRTAPTVLLLSYLIQWQRVYDGLMFPCTLKNIQRDYLGSCQEQEWSRHSQWPWGFFKTQGRDKHKNRGRVEAPLMMSIYKVINQRSVNLGVVFQISQQCWLLGLSLCIFASLLSE